MEDRGLADIDAAAATSWLRETGQTWGPAPLLVLGVAVLAALEGLVVAVAVVALGLGFLAAHLVLRRD